MKTLATTGIALLTVGLLLSGCAAGVPSPEPKAAAEVAGCNADDETFLADAALTQDAVTDEFGTYCKITISPAAPAAEYDPSKVDLESMAEHGFTEDDAKAALASALKFLTEVTMDSTILDNSDNSESEWVQKNKELFTPQSLPSVEQSAADGNLFSTGVIIYKGIPSPLARDGGARTEGISVSQKAIHAGYGTNKSEPSIIVTLEASAVFSASDDAVVQSILENNSDKTEGELRTESPELFDESELGELIVEGHFVYGFLKGNYEQLEGTACQYEIVTDTGAVILS